MDDSLQRVAEIYERFERHIELHGAPVRSDKQIWKWVDEMSMQTLVDLVRFAQAHGGWNYDLQSWMDEVADRSPFWVRNVTDKHKSSNNNTMMWKLMMLFREVIASRMQEQARPANALFEWQR